MTTCSVIGDILEIFAAVVGSNPAGDTAKLLGFEIVWGLNPVLTGLLMNCLALKGGFVIPKSSESLPADEVVIAESSIDFAWAKLELVPHQNHLH